LADAQIGALVSPGQTLFEIIDPARLWVEVQSYDVVPTEIIGQATAYTRNGETLDLAFEGQGLKTREQALPLDFRITRMPAHVYVGQPVSVSLRTRSRIDGIVLPQSSLSRAADGRTQVWLQTAAERYAARPVRTQFLPDGRVLIKSGLNGGERVVSEGAWLLDQIR
jgi:multidrug efflux pump subunit AcrA (membrane-fusion protein)